MDAVFARKTLPFRRIENLSIAHQGERRLFFNETGTAIWSLLDGTRPVDDVARMLATRADFAADLSTAGPPTVDSATADPLPRITASVRQFLQTLHRLDLVEPLSPIGDAAGAEAVPRTDRAAATDGQGAVKPVQAECATVRKSQGAFSIKATREPGVDAPSPIEDRFNDLYWDHCYIQKMHVELTYRCNFRCVQCYNTTHAATDRELTVAEWRDVLAQLAALGCHTLTFTGGEIFVRKDAPDILQAACDHGFSFRLNTNGSLVTESLIRKLEPMRPFLQSLDVSFYGATPQVHDTLARRLGGYQATLKAVRLLAEAKMPLMTKFVTMRDNFDGIAKWKTDMQALGVKHSIATGTLIPRTDRNTEPLVQLLTDDQYKDILTMSPVNEEGGAHYCRPGYIRGCITPDGFVSPCEWLTDFKFGNLRDRSLQDIWYADETVAFRRIFEEASECPSCELRPGCSRCPAHSYLETGNLLTCAPSPRHYAEIYHQAKHA
jgi:radical SAM protein with 4Fe4S-binding SPASM domain